jgi:predicted nucleotide-binding protein
MRKSKTYYGVRFEVSVIDEAFNSFTPFIPDAQVGPDGRLRLEAEIDGARWTYDTYAEFMADYPKANAFDFNFRNAFGDMKLTIASGIQQTSVDVSVQLPKREYIETVFGVFERHLPDSAVTVKSHPIKIFIGHGHNSQWRDLKDHLHEQHGFQVEAYEIGPRAGLTVKEVLEGMLTKSSFALLVLTGEDEDAEGQLHARENVIHEAGLFQGRLGFRRAIVLLEQGCKEFSNIHGLDQIRFSKGKIRETFGDVLATIKREFEDNSTGSRATRSR